MKKTIVLLAGLALAGTAFAQVNPAKPMITGRSNVEARPARTIKTNQTASPAAIAADEEVKLDKLVVTGSLMKHPVKTARR